MQLLLVKKICKDESTPLDFDRISTCEIAVLDDTRVLSKALSSFYPALFSYTFDRILLQIKYTYKEITALIMH